MNTAVQIVEKVGGSYVLNESALNKILQQKNVLNKKVAVLTVAGAFRKGKSFFLSNCVRYLQCKNSSNDWMDPTAAVTGFTWRQDRESVTEGILMWPEPFIVKDAKGEEVAILLMDTEGAFDHKSSMTQCATVFALAALMSSVLAYNVMHDIQEDTLNHLQFFASYGRYSLDEEDSNSPFQSLLFLIRDWQNDDEYGMEAGRQLLDDTFKVHASSNASMQSLRKDIQRSFVDMKCALLPNPGNKICKGSEGTITVNDMDEDFQAELADLVPRLFDHLLLPKEIGGRTIKGAEFLEYFKTYSRLFASGKVPEPKSIFDATAEATHQSALNESLNHYNNTMKAKFAQLSTRQFFEDSRLKSIHQEISLAAVKLFTDTKKMGMLPKFLESLKLKIEAQFIEVFLTDNQNRIEMERVRKEKEEAERRRIEQERRAREELAEKEREKERMRVQMEKERKEKEEAERKRAEAARRHEEELRREREAAEKRRVEEQRRRERERREQEEEMERQMERTRRQMEQMRLESERKEREREQREREREAEHKREMERERQRREEAEREARQAAQAAAQRAAMQFTMQSSYGGFGGYGGMSSPCDSFGSSPSYSNASRAGTPSGRSVGRPRGSVMDRAAMGIMPSEGSRDWNILRRNGW